MENKFLNVSQFSYRNKNEVKSKERKLDEILKVNDKGLVSARNLHEFLEVKTRFNDWISGRVKKYEFVENSDFITVIRKKVTAQGNQSEYTDYAITIDMAICLCRVEKFSKKNIKAIKYLQNLKNVSIEVIGQKRHEYIFGDMLNKITGFEWESQYSIDGGKYRLDFYLRDILIVEYDEEHHKYQKKQDEERIRYCRDWLAKHDEKGNLKYDDGWRCPVIRVKKGEELEGLNRIIRHLAGFECFDEQYNYDLACCDLLNR